jgi:hypothetical protein
VIADSQRLAPQYLFERSAGRMPNVFAIVEQVESATDNRAQHGFCRSQRPMKLDLAEHVIARLQIFFYRIDPARLHVNSIRGFVDGERVDDPLEIVDAILGSGHE